MKIGLFLHQFMTECHRSFLPNSSSLEDIHQVAGTLEMGVHVPFSRPTNSHSKRCYNYHLCNRTRSMLDVL